MISDTHTKKILSPLHLSWKDMHFKRHLVLLQQTKAFNPLYISEEIIILCLGILRVIGMVVQHMSNPSHALEDRMTLENVIHVISREVALSDYGCTTLLILWKHGSILGIRVIET